jgi:HD-like signal output (HDOD) protein
MSADEQTQFLQQLAEDLNSRNINLPSFPDVVINIRTALEDPKCTSERLADVVRTDPVLVARLLMAANSAYHNRAGIEIVDLNLAISRLGFEVVRNTAITLAVEQIFNASEHEDLRDAIKGIWTDSVSLASMSFVIATKSKSVNPDNAFLSGLLHGIGKLYILTKARDFPGLLGNPDSLASVLEDWTPSVGRSIVESWGFSPEIAESLEIEDNLHPEDGSPATVVDVVHAAKILLEDDEDTSIPDEATAGKLAISEETLPSIREAYQLHAQSMRQSAGG